MRIKPSPMSSLADIIPFFEQQIPFNAWLGMKVASLTASTCRVRVPYRPELVGDPLRPALHGGVLSALADTAGGLAVFGAIGTSKARVSTVDLRVDYYAPAELRDVYADATVMRIGNRVGVARILLHHGDPEQIVAEGKGVYNIKKPE